ncbi:hypothetical protein EX895_003844 [Sporisorium graminicola]|uniref:DFDF domain-containing protein n=1 Tax=Sporisorium graminicola TaxID=280036 RepID=A0A4U7KT02_9BASI|nr:hypothetical protein EX895_003844 [Sporisorium graminicola]TKY87167.1 hypothetical protein EX895_003844 [Sporisorium graminicola]
MSSAFIGLDVKLTLHSKPGSHLHAKILSIDQSANTLTVQKQDGSQAVLKRADIASLAAATAPKPTSAATKAAPPVSNPSRSDTATPAKAQSKQKKHQEPEHAAVSSKPAATSTPAFVDPAIMSFDRSSTPAAPSSEQNAASHLLAPLHASDLAASRSSTPTRSPQPKHASTAAPTAKSAKKKQAAHTPVSRGGSPAIPNASLSDDFDFSAGLKAFDKKKIWDDIRASDHTDPASLLVSHNRIVNTGATELVRGPNGVGPANSYSTPERGRSHTKNGQQKLRPNEMVCSPSPERAPSPTPIAPPKQQTVEAPKPSQTSTPDNGKPTYEQLEERIRKLEAELALARRRNVLLEELAGLGLGVSTRADAVPVTSSPPHPDTNGSKSSSRQGGSSVDADVAETEKSLTGLSLQPQSSKAESKPVGLSNALAAAGFAISASDGSANSTPAPATPTSISGPAAAIPAEAESEKQEPLFGHIVDPPVLTLLFPTAALQHAALARMEAFYESDSKAKRYLSLQQAADERICRNYQGFNFPIRQGVLKWLEAMFEATGSDEDTPKWWTAHCSSEENQLLDLLVSLNAISPYEGATSRNADAANGEMSYVISCVASQAHSTLPHELLHALYFLSPSYRAFVSRQYASLSSASKKVIETDLGMRKYSPSVFEDEFQAYLAEGLGTEKEFGNKPAAECKDIAQQLRQEVTAKWKKLGLDLESGKQQEKWEDVKWQTLDRYAAVQKASKKSKAAAAAGSPAKGKGGKKSNK